MLYVNTTIIKNETDEILESPEINTEKPKLIASLSRESIDSIEKNKLIASLSRSVQRNSVQFQPDEKIVEEDIQESLETLPETTETIPERSNFHSEENHTAKNVHQCCSHERCEKREQTLNTFLFVFFLM